jgi:hypothetical protein
VPAAPEDAARPRDAGPAPAQGVRTRPGGRAVGQRSRLDAAMREQRQIGGIAPHRPLEVDQRAARRAIRWGKAEDMRVATLDESMKQRRQAERIARAQIEQLQSIPLDQEPHEIPSPPPSGPGRQLFIWAIVFAAVVVGVMIFLAVKLF